MKGYGQAYPIEMPDLKKAVYSFILDFALPAIDGQYIFYGRQNNMVLPPGAYDYAVYTHLYEERKGTNAYFYDKAGTAEGAGVEYISRYSIADFQLDFYSADTKARDRAAAIEAIARSPAGAAFFEARGIACLYADDPKSMEYVNSSDIYVYRWLLTLRLGYRSKVGVATGYFDAVDIKRVEDVDAFYPPKK